MLSQKLNCRAMIPTVLLMISFLNGSQAQEVKQPSCRTIISFSSPGPSPQDLAWDGKSLWAADDSTDIIYELDPSNGSIVSFFPAPGPKPRGLTWDGTYLWCSDGDSGRIFKLDPKDGSIIFSLPVPVSDASNAPLDQVRGLAWDGQYLWSAYYSVAPRVVKLDPKDGSTKDFIFTLFPPEGLTSDGRYLWIAQAFTPEHPTRNVYQYPIIYYRAYGSGHFEIPSYSPAGLAYDGTSFWIVDRVKKKIYKVAVE